MPQRFQRNYPPEFRREGQQIVFGLGGMGGKADIFVMNADGTEIRPVLQHAA